MTSSRRADISAALALPVVLAPVVLAPVVLALVLVLSGGCGEPSAPDFPADYAATYVEVRDCRSSADHDLHRIRVVADPAAAGPYIDRDRAFPEGAVLLKEEYDFADDTCAGPVVEWTVMRSLGGDDWRWQRVDLGRTVTAEDDSRCIGCHSLCGVGPDGYLGTCAVP